MWIVETTDLFDHWFDSLDDTDRACVGGNVSVTGARTNVTQTIRRYG